MSISTYITQMFRPALVVMAVALTLVAAACGSENGDSNAPANEAAPPAQRDASEATAPADSAEGLHVRRPVGERRPRPAGTGRCPSLPLPRTGRERRHLAGRYPVPPRDRLGDRWLGFSDEKLARLLKDAGLTDVRVNVGARRTGDPFTVLVASGVKPGTKTKAKNS